MQAAGSPEYFYRRPAQAGRKDRLPVERRHRGFTLLEILLAIALLALIVTATVGMSANLIGDKSVTVDDVFWKAVNAARTQALMSQQDVRFSFDPKTKEFVIVANTAAQTAADENNQSSAETPAGPEESTGPDAGTGVPTSSAPGAKTFAVPSGDEKLTVDFLPADKSTGSTELIGGELIETQAMPFVTFYSDGTCTPFRVQFHLKSTARIIGIDPWTCAQVLEEKK
jgi:prepilin-type N-terminal cleavage/methylation domain-containing protein